MGGGFEGQAAATGRRLRNRFSRNKQQQQQQQPTTAGGRKSGKPGEKTTGSTENGGADNTGQTPQIPSENTGGSISYSDADLKLMAAIIQAGGRWRIICRTAGGWYGYYEPCEEFAFPKYIIGRYLSDKPVPAGAETVIWH